VIALTPTRGRALSAGPILLAVLVAGTLAVAQPSSRPAHVGSKPKPAASAVDMSNDDFLPSAQPSRSPDAGAPPASGTGAIPAPPLDVTADGGRLSPLNPAPNEFSDGGASKPAPDYDRLLADIASLRARVAAVGDTLFHSHIAIRIDSNGDHARVANLSIWLDDGVVWTSPSPFRPDGFVTVYEHAVAPGHHAIAVDVERRDDRNDAFRSSQRSRFVVDVPSDQRLLVDLSLWDDSNMGADFPSEHEGRYDIRVRARAKAAPFSR
jgi:hypothetical protein